MGSGKRTMMSAPEGYVRVQMTPDGDCLFRAVSRFLYGTQQLHAKTRGKCVSYMRQYSQTFAPFVSSDAEEFEAYCRSMESRGTWGGNPELSAMAHAFDIRFIVHNALSRQDTEICIGCHRRKEALHLLYDGVHYDLALPSGDDDHRRAEEDRMAEQGLGNLPGTLRHVCPVCDKPLGQFLTEHEAEQHVRRCLSQTSNHALQADPCTQQHRSCFSFSSVAAAVAGPAGMALDALQSPAGFGRGAQPSLPQHEAVHHFSGGGFDEWRLRRAPSLQAPEVGFLTLGQRF